MHLCAMKTIVLWAFLLGTVICGDYSEMSKCAADPTNIKFSLKSYRNQTGHWQTQVQLQNTDVKKDAASWDVDIDQTFTPRCNGYETVLVVATVTVPPEGNAAVKPQPQKCVPEGYKKFSEGHYFRVNTEPFKWAEAQAICVKEGANLAVMNSESEAKFVASLWPSNSPSVFIGIHDLYEEGKYVTIYNETVRDVGYNKWSAGEPDGGTYQNCGLLLPNLLLANGGCNDPKSFFCELQF